MARIESREHRFHLKHEVSEAMKIKTGAHHGPLGYDRWERKRPPHWPELVDPKEVLARA